MHRRLKFVRTLAYVAAALCALPGLPASAVVSPAGRVLPNGWILPPPRGAEAQTGTMPQGMAASPDGSTIAVVESGYNPATLGLYRVPDLARTASIALPGAFGRPVWIDSQHVLVAGANADAVIDIDVPTQRIERFAFPKGSYPVAVAASPDGATLAVATDGDAAIRVGTLATVGTSSPITVGAHPSGLGFRPDGRAVFVTSRAASELVKVDLASRGTEHRKTGLHPSGLAVRGDTVYVAESDADRVGVYDARDLRLVKTLNVGDPGVRAIGASPDAVTIGSDGVFVSLGAANSVAVIRNDHLIGRMEAGWYPTDSVELGGKLYVLDGKGEGARPNPRYSRRSHDVDYIGAIEFGSLRAYDIPANAALVGSPHGSPGWRNAAPNAFLRPGGPIRHVIFVLKENRTYDQILGDVAKGNGDPSLTWFGRDVTPNQHALAARFGLFDNAYASGEVSAAGHNWSDEGFANDYVERWWPALYGGRRALDDLTSGDGARLPSGGYLWDAARRAGVSFRDYGELVAPMLDPRGPWFAAVPSLQGRIDPRYAGWNLRYSDFDRVKEWQREFEAMTNAGTLPQLEFVWLPNDHTYGAKAGELTPASYLAINDAALGRMVDAVSHSKVWKSSAMFVIEDDAQDGPDHVSDQRTTLYVISPYARGGVRHEHYATVSVLRTVEAILGMAPLSAYDATAKPMAAAFGATADLRPYVAIPPKIDVSRRNAKVAYGSAISAKLDFSRADAAPPAILNDILAHNHSSDR